MKQRVLLMVMLVLGLSLAACGAPRGGQAGAEDEPVELVVFAAASLTEALDQVAALYREVEPDVTLTFNFDSSGTLKTQIQEGADCDLFLSAAQKQMDQLDGSKDAGEGNPEGLDFVLQGARVDLLENKVVLVAPKGNPAGISSFEDVGGKARLVALGNSDVPVGQYAQEVFTSLGIWDALNAEGRLTFAANVKEVAAQVSEAAVDCGVVYATDASAAGLEIVAAAPEGSHRPVVYPAAVLNTTGHETQARAFLDFLRSEACTAVFEGMGFSIPA